MSLELRIIKLLLGITCLALTSCSSGSYSKSHLDTLSKAAQLQGYTIIRSDLSTDILWSINQRLAASASRAGYEASKLPTTLIIKSNQCLALNLSDSLLISDFLILQLDHITELAFIIAHEMSHSLLQHQRENANLQTLHNAEFEADYLALGMIAYAGYNPWYAVDALIKAYRCNYWASSESHPPLQARVEAMTKQLSSLGFGSENYASQNRNFLKLKHALQQN